MERLVTARGSTCNARGRDRGQSCRSIPRFAPRMLRPVHGRTSYGPGASITLRCMPTQPYADGSLDLPTVMRMRRGWVAATPGKRSVHGRAGPDGMAAGDGMRQAEPGRDGHIQMQAPDRLEAPHPQPACAAGRDRHRRRGVEHDGPDRKARYRPGRLGGVRDRAVRPGADPCKRRT